MPERGSYETQVRIRFTQCDPAGIVFYPRYFEIFNDLVEDWFRESLHLPFEELINHRGWGVPTVHLEVDFSSPSRFGDVLDAQLTVVQVGGSSINLRITLRGPDHRERVIASVVLVLIDRAANEAIPLPPDLRTALTRSALIEAEA
ncbi:MAG: acyl-CoA thioesterase [Acidobacteriales bacterium]|nr:acyl-CoA thioesterase [Terriglobales bacterium]